jgi:hypothetical protein
VKPLTSAHIEFGPNESYGMLAPVDLNNTDYRTLLLGMKPSTVYHFRIVAESGENTYTSDDFLLETGPPTNLVSLQSFDVIDESAREPGFIVLSYWNGMRSDVAFIIDRDGDIVWWYQSGLEGICRARMSADGKRMWMVVPSNGGGKVAWVTMDTLSSEEYDLGGSHDITPVSGATMAYLNYAENDCNSIYEINPEGQDTEVFEGEGVVTGGDGFACHLNALRYSASENAYTFSDINSGIYVVDRSTGALKWRLSDLTGDTQAWGGVSHGHHLLDSSILVFGNKGGDNASGVYEYALDGQEIFFYDSGLSAHQLGDVQRLPGGNTLVSYSNNDSIIHEIDGDDNLVLAIDAGNAYLAYTLWRKTLYGPPPDLTL